MPGEGFFKHLGRVAPALLCFGYLFAQQAAVRLGHAIADDDFRALARCEATQVGETDFGDDDVDVVLGMVHMRNHRHDAGNLAVLVQRQRHGLGIAGAGEGRYVTQNCGCSGLMNTTSRPVVSSSMSMKCRVTGSISAAMQVPLAARMLAMRTVNGPYCAVSAL